MLVAITCCLDRGRRLRSGYDYYYVSRAYAQAVGSAGLTPVLVGADADPVQLAQHCAALLLSGGDDLPRTFNGPSLEGTLGEAEDLERVAWERRTLDAFVQQARPVLGVCYGMQLMNLHFGGTLHRSVRTEHPGALDHGGSGAVTLHEVLRTESQPGPLLAGFPPSFTTNSSHGQALAQIAPNFLVTAWASDGVVEAFQRDLLFGVEWHPESDATGKLLYDNFAHVVRSAGS